MSNPQFAELLNNPQLLRAITELGYTSATQVQEKAIPLAIEGKNLLVQSKTGSGKTAAFLLPSISRILTEVSSSPLSTRILILTPTRELARQIVKSAQELLRFTTIRVGMICGGEELKYQKALLRKNPEIIVATPGRLAEHIAHKSTDFSGLEILILDEADRMMDMGLHEDLIKIVAQCSSKKQTLLFSATLEQKNLRQLIQDVMGDNKAEKIVVDDAPNPIEHKMVLSDGNPHKNKLLLASLQNNPHQKAIVFANTRARVDELNQLLRQHEYAVSLLHGDITQDERKKALDRFRDSKTTVLVATDVAARGLDIDAVELVINIDMAYSGDEYLHRVGRTGRAGQSGLAISFVTAKDWNLTKGIERYLGIHMETMQIPGFTAVYKGPEKVKASGKAVGIKKKTTEKPKVPEKKVKDRLRDKKNVGKRRQASTVTIENQNPDGFAPPKKKLVKKLDQLGDTE
ncbi:MAG: DEAD/DEAH box helicase [Cellvibrio sp.]|nr:DEAD/DEAH box helicase [Cellvibrio sp.]